jgi:hypothetical protein
VKRVAASLRAQRAQAVSMNGGGRLHGPADR